MCRSLHTRARGCSARLSRLGLVMLPELVLMVFLVSLVTGLLLTVSLGSQRTYTTSDAILQVQGETRRAFDRMLVELRKAGGSVSASGSQVEFQLPLGYDLSSSPCVRDTVCWGAYDRDGIPRPGWSVRYQLAGPQLRRQVFGSGPGPRPPMRVLANNISQASFTYVAGPPPTVTISLQAQRTSSQIAGGSVTASPIPLVMRINLRNG